MVTVEFHTICKKNGTARCALRNPQRCCRDKACLVYTVTATVAITAIVTVTAIITVTAIVTATATVPDKSQKDTTLESHYHG